MGHDRIGSDALELTPALGSVPNWRPKTASTARPSLQRPRERRPVGIWGGDEAARSLSDDVQAELLLRFFAEQGP